MDSEQIHRRIPVKKSILTETYHRRSPLRIHKMLILQRLSLPERQRIKSSVNLYWSLH